MMPVEEVLEKIRRRVVKISRRLVGEGVSCDYSYLIM
jgi:hypothetical protein